MKPLCYLLVSICLSLSFIPVFGQDKSKSTKFDFFAKGENSYTLGEKAYYGRLKYIPNDQDYSRSNRTNLDLDWNHWFGGGLGAGLNINTAWSGTHFFNNSTDQKNRSWTITPNLAYGKTLSDKFGVYARADLSLGWGKDIYKTPANNTSSKSDLFGYGGSIGLPYRFSDYTTLTAEVRYDHLRTKFENAKGEENSFGVNLFLEDYRRCNQLRCDHSTGFKLSKDKFDQGKGFINYQTGIWFESGDRTNTYNMPTYTYKNKFSNFNGDLNGSFYVIDNLAIGGRLGFGHSLQRSDDNSFRNTYDYLRFDPEVIINAPVDNGWRNLFIKGGGYFGSEKTQSKSIGLTSTYKAGITGYNAGIGYYSFFSDQTAVRTCIYYGSTTYNEKNSTEKATYKGIAVSVGLVHSFGN